MLRLPMCLNYKFKYLSITNLALFELFLHMLVFFFFFFFVIIHNCDIFVFIISFVVHNTFEIKYIANDNVIFC